MWPRIRKWLSRRKLRKLAQKPSPEVAKIRGIGISPRYASLLEDAKRLSIPTSNLGEMYSRLIEHDKATSKEILTAETERLVYSGSEPNYLKAEEKAKKHLREAGIEVE